MVSSTQRHWDGPTKAELGARVHDVLSVGLSADAAGERSDSSATCDVGAGAGTGAAVGAGIVLYFSLYSQVPSLLILTT